MVILVLCAAYFRTNFSRTSSLRRSDPSKPLGIPDTKLVKHHIQTGVIYVGVHKQSYLLFDGTK